MSQFKELPQVGFEVAAQNAFKKSSSSMDVFVALNIGGAFLHSSSHLLWYH